MMQNDIHEEKPAFSYGVKVGHVSTNAFTVKAEADSRELVELAKVWKVVSVEALSADLQINRWKRDGIRVKGKVCARLTQECVVTLDPIETRIEEEFEQIFVPEGSKLARVVTGSAAEMVLDPDGPDLPETFAGDTLDVGPIISEFVALAIDPYPRKPGAEFADHIELDDEQAAKRPSPFAALKDWKSEQ